MIKLARRARLGVWLLCAVTYLSAGLCAAGSAIGLIVADGSFHVDHSRVFGNATLFDGNVIETSISSSQLHLAGGINAGLAAASRAQVYGSRMILEKGIGQSDSSSYRIEAAGLQVRPDGTGATARVQMTGSKRIVVAARAGEVLVSNRSGVLIARLESGHEMSFEPQQGGTVTKVSGILSLKDGKFVVVDRVTNVTMQLQGSGLEAEVGNLVEVTGTVDAAPPTVPGASQLIDVTKVKRLVKGAEAASAASAAGTGAAAGGGTAAAAGLSTGAVVAIVGGVAAAGTVIGLAAAKDLPGQGGGAGSTSR